MTLDVTIDLAGRTHVGLKRSENQDDIFAELLFSGAPPFACLAVADGMGGHQKGKEASGLAIETLRSGLERRISKEGRQPNEQWCTGLETEAHSCVSAISSGGEISGTTLTLALLNGNECLIGHVGDSRAYRFREGRLDQLTEDQTWEEYSRKNAVENPYGQALRQAVGVRGDFVPATYRFEMRSGDWLLLCSDGLYKMTDSAQIGAELAAASSAKDACERLIRLALAGGGRDNVAVCIARIQDLAGRPKHLDRLLVAAVLAAFVVTSLLVLALMGKIG